jgi:hypothetical protein
MADGYVIEVTRVPGPDGEPSRETWYAHIHDRDRAVRAVRKAAGAGRQAAVDVVRAEKHRILLERLAILEGEVVAQIPASGGTMSTRGGADLATT